MKLTPEDAEMDGGAVLHPFDPPDDSLIWYRRWMGDESVFEIQVSESGESFSSDAIRAIFPEAGVVFIPQSRRTLPPATQR